MSKLLSTSRCPKCESRGQDRRGDNLAEYADGWHCFSCGYRKPKRSLSNLKRLEAFSEVRPCDGITLEKKLPLDALKWLSAYDLTFNEMENFRYANKRVKNGYEIQCNLLVLIHSDTYWLARNLDNIGLRYLSSGDKPFLIYGNNPDVVVIVEDVISAIKVARVASSVPMLGSSFKLHYGDELKRFGKVVLWGDRDKAIDNCKQARKLSEVLGKPVHNVITEKDPKYFTTEQISNIIK